MRLLELENYDGESVFVNPERVTMVTWYLGEGDTKKVGEQEVEGPICLIYFDSDEDGGWAFKGTIDEIRDALISAPR